jgi:o-succinylbenzoate synthase
MRAHFCKYTLNFKTPGGTSRGVLKEKDTWFLILEEGQKWGVGECGMFRGLSFDDVPNYEEQLQWVCDNIQLGKDVLWEKLKAFPSIQFGVEQAFLSFTNKEPMKLFSSDFTEGRSAIDINGLIWMGPIDKMREQVVEKIIQGFTCVKLKIGALDFEEEYSLLQSIRKEFSPSDIELRVDANGAFLPNEALEKLKRLSDLKIHSIEQPIKPGQRETMAELCSKTPLPIALDEELIGVNDIFHKALLLQEIMPQYIILKPSLVGGFKGSQEWISLAQTGKIGWWITSALESNIGLNAIAQWTHTLKNDMPQGLGTGSLFTNNIDAPLVVDQGALHYKNSHNWDYQKIITLCI